MRIRTIPLHLALLVVPVLLTAATQPHSFDDRSLTIGRITINRKNIFETGRESDHHFPYSWANKIHIVTKESFVRNELLFQEGAHFNLEKIRETERILRSRPVFRYVSVVPQNPVNGVVDIEINTEDVWTTTIRLSYGAAGGRSFYSLGFLEHNLFGTGKEVGAFVRKDIDRLLRGVSYKDTQLFGSRWTMALGYGKDEKGRDWETRIEKPFYSVLVPHSEGAGYRYREDEERLFQNGDEVAHFESQTEDLRVFTSYALRPSQEKVRRVILAHERRQSKFTDIQGPAAPVLPEKRVTSAALLGFDFRNEFYHKVRGVRTFDRDEDINLGWEWLVEAGPSLTRWDATQNGTVGHLQVKKTLHPVEDMVWFNHLDIEGRLEHGIIRNGTMKLRSHYFFSQWKPKNTASVRGEITTSKNLDPERQFLLGGETGLRGYSIRQFSGDQKFLMALENRSDIVYDWLNLMSLGWATFLDTGAAWTKRDGLTLGDFKSDVGVGLRLAPSRSFDPGLIRIDVAYALQDNNKKSRFVINIGADLMFGERRKSRFEQ